MNTSSITATATPPQPAQASIEVTSIAARLSVTGAPDWFTGTVVVDPLFPPNAYSAASGGLVTFTPGARTAWHAHPVGQVLIVTAGQGWLQAWGEERRSLRAGDVAWIPPQVKHWHGASETHAMSHIAIQEVRDGSAADWMEHVDDGQYRT